MKVDSSCDSCIDCDTCPNSKPKTFHTCDKWLEGRHHTYLDRLLDFYWWRWQK